MEYFNLVNSLFTDCLTFVVSFFAKNRIFMQKRIDIFSLDVIMTAIKYCGSIEARCA